MYFGKFGKFTFGLARALWKKVKIVATNFVTIIDKELQT